jgi:hypothetical protein
MRASLVVSMLVGALAVPAVAGVTTRDTSTTAKPLSPAKYTAGRNIYRKYCGQCHALTVARAVGFGQAKEKTEAGPSFNKLRVPFKLSISAVVLSTIGGHETIQHRMRWQELYDVAKWLDQVTKGHPIMAPGVDYLTGR